MTFKAHRTTEGTFPAGSEWTKNPIPLCNGTAFGFLDWMDCRNGFEFPPPAGGHGLQGDRLAGTGQHVYYKHDDYEPIEPDADKAFRTEFDFFWNIMDEVEVPKDLIPGDYVLSFRWDCEATPQIWNSCANIKIIK